MDSTAGSDDGSLLLCRRPVSPGLEHAAYGIQGQKPEHGNLDRSLVFGAELAAETGEDAIKGRSLHSSRSTGKPCTGPRQARNR
jgi:hypothetical protein